MRRISFSVIILLILISCSDVPDITEYQGVNYIQYRPLDVAIGNIWTSDDPVEGAYHYMGFNTDSTGAADLPAVAVFTGLPNNADSGDISRLEIFNLVPDGGFESGTAGWDNTGTTANATFPRENSDPLRVNDDAGNNSMEYTIPASTDILRFNLSTLSDTFLLNKNYISRLSFTRATTDDTAVFEYNDGSSANIYRTWKPKVEIGWSGGDTAAFTRFPDYGNLDTGITAKAGSYFCIGSFDDNYSKIQDGFIDDFRIVRSDLDYYLRLTVPYTDTGRPELYSGIYRFSVYVKGEADADVSPSQNRFRSSRISLGINNYVTGFQSSSYSSTSWTKISVEKFIQIDKGDTLELRISPSDSTALPNSMDIGSVLIAAPSLYYISE